MGSASQLGAGHDCELGAVSSAVGRCAARLSREFGVPAAQIRVLEPEETALACKLPGSGTRGRRATGWCWSTSMTGGKRSRSGARCSE
jgi:hypothetical protein